MSHQEWTVSVAKIAIVISLIVIRDAVKKKTSYSVTLSLLPLTPSLPRPKVTNLISDKVVF